MSRFTDWAQSQLADPSGLVSLASRVQQQMAEMAEGGIADVKALAVELFGSVVSTVLRFFKAKFLEPVQALMGTR